MVHAIRLPLFSHPSVSPTPLDFLFTWKSPGHPQSFAYHALAAHLVCTFIDILHKSTHHLHVNFCSYPLRPLISNCGAAWLYMAFPKETVGTNTHSRLSVEQSCRLYETVTSFLPLISDVKNTSIFFALDTINLYFTHNITLCTCVFSLERLTLNRPLLLPLHLGFQIHPSRVFRTIPQTFC